MELISKFPSVHKISWARRKENDFSVSNVDPICIFVVSKGLENNPAAASSTPVDICTVEDEIHRPLRQNGLLSIADEAFGDISSFLQYRHGINDQLPIPEESTDQENEHTHIAIPESSSTAIECPENEEVNRIEAASSPENAESKDSVRTSVCDISVSRKAPVLNTDKKYKPSIYIHTHFEMMYIFKTCTYRTLSQNFTDKNTSPMSRASLGIQMAIFVTIVALSAFQSFCDAKYFLLWFLAGSGLNQLVRFAFDLTNLVSCAYGAHILCRKENVINKMAQAMNIYENKWEGKRAQPAISFVLVTITVVLASMKAILTVDFDDISMEGILLQGSNELSEDLFLWSSADLNVTTLELEMEFGSNLNSKTILMGIVKIFRSFSFALLQGMIWDIIGNIVLMMLCWMTFFMTFVHTVEENIPGDNEVEEDNDLENRPEEIEPEISQPKDIKPEENILGENKPEETQVEADKLQRQRVVVWKMYRQIRVVFAAVNEVFGPLLMLFHVTNVLRYAFFMERLIYPEEATTFEYIHLLYDIVKSEIVYFTATNIAKQNKVIRKWLRNWAVRTGKIDLGYTEKDITVVLDELDEEPLGLGQGDLLIHQGFHFGLLGLVSSLFVMLANKTGAKL